MNIEKPELGGVSLFFSNGFMGLDIFMPKKPGSRQSLLDLNAVKRVTIRLNKRNPIRSVIHFEKTDDYKEYFLYSKVEIGKLIERNGFNFIFTAIPTIVSTVSHERRISFIRELSAINNEDIIRGKENPELVKSEVTETIEKFLGEVLSMSGGHITRFTCPEIEQ